MKARRCKKICHPLTGAIWKVPPLAVAVVEFIATVLVLKPPLVPMENKYHEFHDAAW